MLFRRRMWEREGDIRSHSTPLLLTIPSSWASITLTRGISVLGFALRRALLWPGPQHLWGKNFPHQEICPFIGPVCPSRLCSGYRDTGEVRLCDMQSNQKRWYILCSCFPAKQMFSSIFFNWFSPGIIPLRIQTSFITFKCFLMNVLIFSVVWAKHLNTFPILLCKDLFLFHFYFILFDVKGPWEITAIGCVEGRLSSFSSWYVEGCFSLLCISCVSIKIQTFPRISPLFYAKITP